MDFDAQLAADSAWKFCVKNQSHSASHLFEWEIQKRKVTCHFMDAESLKWG